jgi:NADH:ubiquinone oxidoreductase subunit 2 (subunit N)
MTSETLLASLHLSIPELILAIGALVLLMIGVFSGERSGRMVSVLAIIVLRSPPLWLVFVPANGSPMAASSSRTASPLHEGAALIGSSWRCSCRSALPRRTSSTSSSSRF